jgi:hypothetical protein
MKQLQGLHRKSVMRGGIPPETFTDGESIEMLSEEWNKAIWSTSTASQRSGSGDVQGVKSVEDVANSERL